MKMLHYHEKKLKGKRASIKSSNQFPPQATKGYCAKKEWNWSPSIWMDQDKLQSPRRQESGMSDYPRWKNKITNFILH